MAQGAMRWGLLHCASNSGASVPQPLSDPSAHAHCVGKGYPGAAAAGQQGSRAADQPKLTVVCYPRGDRHGGVCMYIPLSSPPRLGEAVPLRVEVGSPATVHLSSEQVPDCTLSTPQTQPTCDCISWSTGTCQSWSRWMNTYPGSVLCGRTHPWIQRSL